MLLLGLTASMIMAFASDNQSGKDDCLTMSFAAYEDGRCIATFDMYSNCTFVFVNKEEQPYQTARGTYEMTDGPIERGCSKRVTLYVDGVYQGYGTLGWPLQQSLMLIMGGFEFTPVR